MKRKLSDYSSLFLLALAFCFTAGCATATGGLTRDVELTTVPESAQVTVVDENGDELDIFTTPGFARIPVSYDKKRMIVSAPGYRTEEFYISNDINPLFWGNCCFGCLLGMAVDGYNGAALSYSLPRKIHLTRMPSTNTEPIAEIEPDSSDENLSQELFASPITFVAPSLPTTATPEKSRRPSNLYRLATGFGYETIYIQESSVRDTGLTSYPNLLLPLGGINLADDNLLMDFSFLFSHAYYSYETPLITQICYTGGSCLTNHTKLDLETIQNGVGYELNFLYNIPLFSGSPEYATKHIIAPAVYFGAGYRMMYYSITQNLPDYSVYDPASSESILFEGETFKSNGFGTHIHLILGFDFEYVRLEGFGGYSYIPMEIGVFTSDPNGNESVETRGEMVNIGGPYVGGRFLLGWPLY
jgi:hypothetical protein